MRLGHQELPPQRRMSMWLALALALTLSRCRAALVGFALKSGPRDSEPAADSLAGCLGSLRRQTPTKHCSLAAYPLQIQPLQVQTGSFSNVVAQLLRLESLSRTSGGAIFEFDVLARSLEPSTQHVQPQPCVYL